MAKCQGRGQGGVIFVSLFYVSCNFKRRFFSKNRQTLFGALKYRQTLFIGQILFYKDFYDFTHQSPVVNGFPSFAMDLREANWRPTYLLYCVRSRRPPRPRHMLLQFLFSQKGFVYVCVTKTLKNGISHAKILYCCRKI